jgi:hypothetical protein
MSDEIWINLFYLISRYIHIVCTTLIVGGTLFYEMVVPVAIGELKSEQQLLVFGRARWMFRSIVWASGLLLVVTGIISTVSHWPSYKIQASDLAYVPKPPPPPPVTYTEEGVPTTAPSATSMPTTAPSTRPVVSLNSPTMRADWWWVAHASTGFLAVLIAVMLTTGATPPSRPVQWMRINMMILLIVIFLATATRQVRQFREERTNAINARAVMGR